MVSFPLSQQLAYNLIVAGKTLGLKDGTFIYVQTEPGYPIEDYLHRLLGRALSIRIFDTENEISTMVPSMKPREKRSASPPNMEVTSWAWGKSGPDDHQPLSFELKTGIVKL
jgi:hypothetical protein